MLPSSGYFKSSPCPFFNNGWCERPHCHFKHIKREKALSKSPLYNPNLDDVINSGTEANKLELLKAVNETIQKVREDVEKEKAQLEARSLALSSVNSETTVSPQYVPTPVSQCPAPVKRYLPVASVPEYRPTPIAQLKRLHANTVTKERKKIIPEDCQYNPVTNFISHQPKRRKVEEYNPEEVKYSVTNKVQSCLSDDETYVPVNIAPKLSGETHSPVVSSSLLQPGTGDKIVPKFSDDEDDINSDDDIIRPDPVSEVQTSKSDAPSEITNSDPDSNLLADSDASKSTDMVSHILIESKNSIEKLKMPNVQHSKPNSKPLDKCLKANTDKQTSMSATSKPKQILPLSKSSHLTASRKQPEEKSLSKKNKRDEESQTPPIHMQSKDKHDIETTSECLPRISNKSKLKSCVNKSSVDVSPAHNCNEGVASENIERLLMKPKQKSKLKSTLHGHPKDNFNEQSSAENDVTVSNKHRQKIISSKRTSNVRPKLERNEETSSGYQVASSSEHKQKITSNKSTSDVHPKLKYHEDLAVKNHVRISNKQKEKSTTSKSTLHSHSKCNPKEKAVVENHAKALIKHKQKFTQNKSTQHSQPKSRHNEEVAYQNFEKVPKKHRHNTTMSKRDLDLHSRHNSDAETAFEKREKAPEKLKQIGGLKRSRWDLKPEDMQKETVISEKLVSASSKHKLKDSPNRRNVDVLPKQNHDTGIEYENFTFSRKHKQRGISNVINYENLRNKLKSLHPKNCTALKSSNRDLQRLPPAKNTSSGSKSQASHTSKSKPLPVAHHGSRSESDQSIKSRVSERANRSVMIQDTLDTENPLQTVEFTSSDTDSFDSSAGYFAPYCNNSAAAAQDSEDSSYEDILEEPDTDLDDHDTYEECWKIFNEAFSAEENSSANQKKVRRLKEEAVPKHDSITSGKKRVAHQMDLQRPLTKKGPTIISPAHAMQNRYQQLREIQERHKMDEEKKVTSSAFRSEVNHASDRKRIAHVPNAFLLASLAEKQKEINRMAIEDSRRYTAPSGTIAATNPKGEKRIAHSLSSLQTNYPVIPTEFGTKVPANIRQRYLNLFIDECIKIYLSAEDAQQRALAEEKIAFDRSSNKVVYLNVAINTLKRLRAESKDGCLPHRDPQPSTSKGVSAPSGSIKKATKPILHEIVLGGSKACRTSFSFERERIKPLDEVPTGRKLYLLLRPYKLTRAQLEECGFPRPHPTEPGKAVLLNTDAKKAPSIKGIERTCCRCLTKYRVTVKGNYVRQEECVHHWGKLWKRRIAGSIERRYSCCQGDSESDGCCVAKGHVFEDLSPDNLVGFVKTLPKSPPPGGNYGVYSLDCEMCYTTAGIELTRITVISTDLKPIYETLVMPEHPILDHNTRFSGITEDDMEGVTTTIRGVQAVLLDMFSDKTILIGHSLDSDFKALRLIHNTVVDTSVVFPHKMGLPYKRALRTLMAEHLNKIIQNSVDGHDSQEDAVACMELMLWKVREDVKRMNR